MSRWHGRRCGCCAYVKVVVVSGCDGSSEMIGADKNSQADVRVRGVSTSWKDNTKARRQYGRHTDN